MRQAWRGLAGLLAVGVVAAGGSVALADDGGGNGGRDNNGNRGNNALASTIFTMPAAPDGNPEGVAVDRRSGRFFVSRTGTGAIFVGTLGSPALQPFIAGVRPNPAPTDPPVATGLKVRKGLLYVAGASTGQIRVYDLANPTAAPKIFETGGGFINDLDLDGDGNVFATDSTKSTIYKVTAAQVAAGTGTPEAIDVSSGITSTPGQFSLNGIIVNGDGDRLIVVNSFSGELFRIAFADNDNDDNDNDRGNRRARAAQAAGTPTITKIDLGGATVKGGDGLLVDRGRLLVVRGSNTGDPNASPAGAKGLIDVVKLSHHRTRGRVESEVFDPSFAGPSTIARGGNRLLVVNANFAAGPDAAQYTVTSLSRNAVRHGRHGGR
jgi:sugar lactone lactonase YvrE